MGCLNKTTFQLKLFIIVVGTRPVSSNIDVKVNQAIWSTLFFVDRNDSNKD